MNFDGRFIKTSLFTLIALLIAVPQLLSDRGPAHKKRLARPIKLGSSGGNVNDQTSQFCCSGTLGAVVKDSLGKGYILSNNHVVGIANKAKVGDPVSQPGHVDIGCTPLETDTVATFTKFIKIKFGPNTNNKVDAAIAQIIPGKVSATGFILDVKHPGQPVEAELGMRVKKSGRTTGLRRGVIDVLNLIIRVSFSNQCGSTGSKVARFTDQVGISDGPGGTVPPFIASGDSGSLLVKDVASCPSTLGLLFAGDNQGNAAANRIQNVLTALGAGMKILGCGIPPVQTQDANALTLLHPEVLRAAAIQNRYQEALLSTPGVVGVGIGLAKPGSRKLALVIYTVRGTAAATASNILPERLENLPLRKKITGEFRAF